jgi:hypothetical protein
MSIRDVEAAFLQRTLRLEKLAVFDDGAEIPIRHPATDMAKCPPE